MAAAPSRSDVRLRLRAGWSTVVAVILVPPVDVEPPQLVRPCVPAQLWIRLRLVWGVSLREEGPAEPALPDPSMNAEGARVWATRIIAILGVVVYRRRIGIVGIVESTAHELVDDTLQRGGIVVGGNPGLAFRRIAEPAALRASSRRSQLRESAGQLLCESRHSGEHAIS